MELDDTQAFTLEVLGDRELSELEREPQRLTWTVQLQPYDLIGARLSAPDVRIRDWRVVLGREVLVRLRQAVDDMRRRIVQLRTPAPLPVLTNPGVELPVNEGVLAGWEHAQGDGIRVRIDDSSSHEGQKSLHLRSDGPVAWVRSNPFATPATGRLAVWMWLKVADPDRQPPLQLAIEGRLDGEAYYRPARVGAATASQGPSPPPLTTNWEAYLVRVDNLPPQVTDLRVAVDLMGAGEVWIDDVRVYDLWFAQTERNELVKLNALADLYLGKGAAVDCDRIVSSYWAEFLRRHVRLEGSQLASDTGIGRERPNSATDPGSAETDPPDAETSWLQRLVPKPRLPSLFR
jgi:hypothetical protein